MKRFFSLFSIFILLAALLSFSGCGSQADVPEEEQKLSLDDSLQTNYDALMAEFENGGDFQQFSSFLSQWAKENQIDVKTSNDRYIVLSKPASAGYEDAETFTLHTAVNFDNETDQEESLQSASTVMSALYKAERHGTLKGIFTLETMGEAVGADALGSTHLKADNFIDMTYAGSTALYNSLAASSEFLATKEFQTASPRYSKAYRITLKGTANKSPYKHGGDYPNAIKTIGDLLASCQSSSILFELASFSGGTSSSLYPEKASALIVLQENDVESFTNRFESSFERVQEYYEEQEEPFEYTMTEAKIPKRVLSNIDSNHIVSLMYTITNGTYIRSDKGEIMAASNIGRISTKQGMFRMEINAKSLENNLMDQMRSVFETTCGLCEIQYKETSFTPLWYASTRIPLISYLMEKIDSTPSGMLENKAAEIYLEKQPKLNLAIWTTDLDGAEEPLSDLLDYMESFGLVEDEDANQ